MKIVDILAPELVLPALAGAHEGRRARRARDAVVARSIPRSTRARSCRRSRTASGSNSTALGEGVAIPHGKLPGVKRVVAAFGRSRAGVDFQSLDGKPTHLFFLLVAPEDSAGAHLKALARISRLLKDESFRDAAAATRRTRATLFDDHPRRGRRGIDASRSASCSTRRARALAAASWSRARAASARPIAHPAHPEAGLALAGYLPQLHPDRVQVLGNSELGYLATLRRRRARRRGRRVRGARRRLLRRHQRHAARRRPRRAAERSGVPVLATALAHGRVHPRRHRLARGAPRARDAAPRRPGRGARPRRAHPRQERHRQERGGARPRRARAPPGRRRRRCWCGASRRPCCAAGRPSCSATTWRSAASASSTSRSSSAPSRRSTSGRSTWSSS